MSSQRHITCERPSPAATREATTAKTSANRISDAELLRAARECVLANGVRRSTLTEVARRAGVSRMTLYRRFPDVHSMVTALMTGELTGTLARARGTEGEGPARDRLVAAAEHCLRALSGNPLLLRVLETDAEMLVPYLVERLGSAQLAAESFLHEYLREGHRDGSVRRGDPVVQARALLLAAQSFVISAVPAADGIDPDALLAEFTRILDAALDPVPDEAGGVHLYPAPQKESR